MEPMMSNNELNEHSVEIAREKTKRTYAWLGLLGILAVLTIALFFQKVGKGSLSVDAGGIEVTIDQPLIDQVSNESRSFFEDGDTVTITTGSVSDTLIEKIEQKYDAEKVLPSDKFVGRNLIDRKAGFVVSTAQPETWLVKHNDAGYTQRFDPIVSMKSKDGAVVAVTRATRDSVTCLAIDCYVTSIIKREIENNAVASKPTVNIDHKTNTALIEYTTRTRSSVMIKVVLENNSWYQARSEVASSTPAEQRNEAQRMVTSFSAIAKTSTESKIRQ